eukprot:GHUV01033440.1.p2 GENE.GHUV01033440.1~~GHUV01033440.1.p2  ORF type:complete len:127 (+),score=7.34 GHUV01033440.1:236-616(+)
MLKCITVVLHVCVVLPAGLMRVSCLMHVHVREQLEASKRVVGLIELCWGSLVDGIVLVSISNHLTVMTAEGQSWHIWPSSRCFGYVALGMLRSIHACCQQLAPPLNSPPASALDRHGPVQHSGEAW